MSARWFASPTLAGKPGGPTHYDIGADDNENIALVYPAEDGPAETVRRARRIAAINPLFHALQRLIEGEGEGQFPWWWGDVGPGGGVCAMCEVPLRTFTDNVHTPDCPIGEAESALELAERGDV